MVKSHPFHGKARALPHRAGLDRIEPHIRSNSLIRIGAGVVSIAIVAWLPTPLHAQSTNISGTVALSSQLVDRGLAITPVTPIFQAAASWTSPTGWSLGLSAGTEVRSPGRVSEALAQASRYWSLSSDWQMEASLLYYDYPSNARSGDFNRVETGVSWVYRDILTFGLSAITLTGGNDQRPRGAADVNFHWPLAEHFSLSVGAGVAQNLISPYGPSGYGHTGFYGYGHAGLVWGYGPWRIDLDRIMIDPESRQQWGSLAPASWVGTISWSF
jgi:uncharacterized protein (TIGR02001 family)